MAITRVLSCESETFARFYSKAGNPVFQTNITDLRTYVHVRAGSPTQDAVSVAPSVTSTLVTDSTHKIGFKFVIATLPQVGYCELLRLSNAFQLRLKTDGDVDLYDSANAFKQTYSTGFTASTTSIDLEVECFASDLAGGGYVKVYVNGSQVGTTQTGDFFSTSTTLVYSFTGEAQTTGSDIGYRAFYIGNDTTVLNSWEVDPLQAGSGATVGGRTPTTGSWLNASELPGNASNFAVWSSSGTWSAWVQDDGTATWTGPNGQSWPNDPIAVNTDFNAGSSSSGATAEYLPPNTLLVQTNYTGAVTDIDDDPDSPDANALVASGGIGIMRCGFATPTTAPATSSKMRVAVSAQGAAGGSQDELPTGINGTPTGYSGAYTLLDDDPQSPGGDWMYTTLNGTSIVLIDMANPSGTLNTGTNQQTIEIYVGKCNSTPAIDAGGSDPTFTVEVYDNGSLHQTLVTDATLTTGGSLFTYNWTAAGLSSPDNVQVRVSSTAAGGGPNRRFVAIDAVRWVATLAETTLNGIVRLFDNAVQMSPSQAFTVAPSEGNKVIELTFSTADLTQNADGSTMECYVTQTDGAPSDYIDIEAVEALCQPTLGTPSFNFYMGNSVDGITNLGSKVVTATSIYGYISASASVIPLKTEYGRVGVGVSTTHLYTLNLYEVFQDALYDPASAATNIGSINSQSYTNIASFNLVAKANWANINGVA